MFGYLQKENKIFWKPFLERCKKLGVKPELEQSCIMGLQSGVLTKQHKAIFQEKLKQHFPNIKKYGQFADPNLNSHHGYAISVFNTLKTKLSQEDTDLANLKVALEKGAYQSIYDNPDSSIRLKLLNTNFRDIPNDFTKFFILTYYMSHSQFHELLTQSYSQLYQEHRDMFNKVQEIHNDIDQSRLAEREQVSRLSVEELAKEYGLCLIATESILNYNEIIQAELGAENQLNEVISQFSNIELN